MAAEHRGVGRKADLAQLGTDPRAAAAGGHVYAGVRRQSRLRLVHRRHWECEMGRNAARSDFTGGRHQKAGIDVVFFGSDEGDEEVRDIKMKQNFSRSMSIEEALAPANLLCYEMNGEPL